MISSARVGLACVVVVGVLGAACVVKTNQEWIRDAAARDLQCPAGQITVHHYTNKPDKKGATGCGKDATWHRVCQDGACRWELDGPPRPAQAAPPPSPAR